MAAVRDDSRREHGGPALSAARQRTAVFIIASPRPRVGRTFLARLLTDFLCLDGSVHAFDIAPGSDVLQDYLPATTTATIDETQGQVALFDHMILNDGIAKVVDLGSTAYQRFFTIIEEIDFVHECRRRAIEPMILFAADPHPASAEAYVALQQRFYDTVLVPIFNEAITQGHKLRERFPIRRAAAVPLQISALAPALKAQADRLPHAFAYFHNQLALDIPAGLAFELRSWTRRTFLEFRELQLRLLLEKLRASLPGVQL